MPSLSFSPSHLTFLSCCRHLNFLGLFEAFGRKSVPCEKGPKKFEQEMRLFSRSHTILPQAIEFRCWFANWVMNVDVFCWSYCRIFCLKSNMRLLESSRLSFEKNSKIFCRKKKDM
jgi:hypothetical protein